MFSTPRPRTALGIAALVACCGALALEAACRLDLLRRTGTWRLPEARGRLLVDDPALGWALRPGYDSRMMAAAADVAIVYGGPGAAERAAAAAHEPAWFTVDAGGFRGPPGAGPVGVLCVGDSVTMGNGVRDAETWPALLGALRPGLGRVVNAGVGGWDSAQVLLDLRRRGLPLRPRLVVALTGWNDAVRAVAGYRPGPAGRPGWMERAPSALARRLGQTLAHRPMYATDAERYQRAIVDRDWMVRWQGNVIHMRDASEGAGTRFVAVVPPLGRGAHVYWSRLHGRLARGLEALQASAGVAVLEPSSAFAEAERLFVDAMHLTAEGNRRLAAAVAGALP